MNSTFAAPRERVESVPAPASQKDIGVILIILFQPRNGFRCAAASVIRASSIFVRHTGSNAGATVFPVRGQTHPQPRNAFRRPACRQMFPRRGLRPLHLRRGHRHSAPAARCPSSPDKNRRRGPAPCSIHDSSRHPRTCVPSETFCPPPPAPATHPAPHRRGAKPAQTPECRATWGSPTPPLRETTAILPENHPYCRPGAAEAYSASPIRGRICAFSHPIAWRRCCSLTAPSGNNAARAVTHVLSSTPGCGLQPPSGRAIELRKSDAPLRKLSRSGAFAWRPGRAERTPLVRSTNIPGCTPSRRHRFVWLSSLSSGFQLTKPAARATPHAGNRIPIQRRRLSASSWSTVTAVTVA